MAAKSEILRSLERALAHARKGDVIAAIATAGGAGDGGASVRIGASLAVGSAPERAVAHSLRVELWANGDRTVFTQPPAAFSESLHGRLELAGLALSSRKVDDVESFLRNEARNGSAEADLHSAVQDLIREARAETTRSQFVRERTDEIEADLQQGRSTATLDLLGELNLSFLHARSGDVTAAIGKLHAYAVAVGAVRQTGFESAAGVLGAAIVTGPDAVRRAAIAVGIELYGNNDRSVYAQPPLGWSESVYGRLAEAASATRSNDGARMGRFVEAERTRGGDARDLYGAIAALVDEVRADATSTGVAKAGADVLDTFVRENPQLRGAGAQPVSWPSPLTHTLSGALAFAREGDVEAALATLEEYSDDVRLTQSYEQRVMRAIAVARAMGSPEQRDLARAVAVELYAHGDRQVSIASPSGWNESIYARLIGAAIILRTGNAAQARDFADGEALRSIGTVRDFGEALAALADEVKHGSGVPTPEGQRLLDGVTDYVSANSARLAPVFAVKPHIEPARTFAENVALLRADGHDRIADSLETHFEGATQGVRLVASFDGLVSSGQTTVSELKKILPIEITRAVETLPQRGDESDAQYDKRVSADPLAAEVKKRGRANMFRGPSRHEVELVESYGIQYDSNQNASLSMNVRAIDGSRIGRSIGRTDYVTARGFLAEQLAVEASGAERLVLQLQGEEVADAQLIQYERMVSVDELRNALFDNGSGIYSDATMELNRLAADGVAQVPAAAVPGDVTTSPLTIERTVRAVVRDRALSSIYAELEDALGRADDDRNHPMNLDEYRDGAEEDYRVTRDAMDRVRELMQSGVRSLPSSSLTLLSSLDIAHNRLERSRTTGVSQSIEPALNENAQQVRELAVGRGDSDMIVLERDTATVAQLRGLWPVWRNNVRGDWALQSADGDALRAGVSPDDANPNPANPVLTFRTADRALEEREVLVTRALRREATREREARSLAIEPSFDLAAAVIAEDGQTARVGDDPRATQKPEDFRAQLTADVIAALERGDAVWQKPWVSQGLPHNGVSKKAYRGGNSVALAMRSMFSGWNDPRFFTEKQLADRGWAIAEDQQKRGSYVEFFDFRDRKVDPTPGERERAEREGTEPAEKTKRYAIQRLYLVFNAAQILAPKSIKIDDDNRETIIAGLKAQLAIEEDERAVELLQRAIYEALEPDAVVQRLDRSGNAPQLVPVTEMVALTQAIPYEKSSFVWDVAERADRIFEALGVPVMHDQSDRAYYIPSADEIHLPPRTAFPTAEKYYATRGHESVHSTGHSSRLARGLENTMFGSVAYAKEELRAELGSMFLSAEVGIEHDTQRHAAYIGSWIKVLKSDKNELFRAARDAHNAVELMLFRERELAISRGDADAELLPERTEPKPALAVELAFEQGDRVIMNAHKGEAEHLIGIVEATSVNKRQRQTYDVRPVADVGEYLASKTYRMSAKHLKSAPAIDRLVVPALPIADLVPNEPERASAFVSDRGAEVGARVAAFMERIDRCIGEPMRLWSTSMHELRALRADFAPTTVRSYVYEYRKALTERNTQHPALQFMKVAKADQRLVLEHSHEAAMGDVASMRRIDTEEARFRIRELLYSEDYLEAAIGVSAATGQPFIDVVKSGVYKLAEYEGAKSDVIQLCEDDQILQAVSADGTVRAVPTIGVPAEIVLETITRLRAGTDLSEKTNKQVDNSYGKRANEIVTRTFGGIVGGDVSRADLRPIYAAVAYETAGYGELVCDFNAKLLGHDNRNPDAAFRYMKFIDHEVRPETARERVTAVRAVLTERVMERLSADDVGPTLRADLERQLLHLGWVEPPIARDLAPFEAAGPFRMVGPETLTGGAVTGVARGVDDADRIIVDLGRGTYTALESNAFGNTFDALPESDQRVRIERDGEGRTTASALADEREREAPRQLELAR